MDAVKVGNAIAYLRKKIGYTQKELADRLGISDKAVSKWERGLGLPDTAIIGKIAILLDSDTDSLLAGDLANHNMGWSGLLIFENSEYGVNLGTIIYDKPLVYFQLSYFMLMGIREIRIVSSEENRNIIKGLFQDGSRLGVHLTYWEDIPYEIFLDDNHNVMIVTGRSIIYGVDQTRFFQRAMLNHDKITMLSLPKKVVGTTGRVYFDSDKKIISNDEGDILRTQYDYYQVPILFCPAQRIKEEYFSSLHKDGLFHLSKMKDDLYTVTLDRGFVEIPINDWDDVMDASSFVKTVQKACGMQIYCIEEIAWRRGMISRENIRELGNLQCNTLYGRYILEIVESESKR